MNESRRGFFGTIAGLFAAMNGACALRWWAKSPPEKPEPAVRNNGTTFVYNGVELSYVLTKGVTFTHVVRENFKDHIEVVILVQGFVKAAEIDQLKSSLLSPQKPLDIRWGTMGDIRCKSESSAHPRRCELLGMVMGDMCRIEYEIQCDDPDWNHPSVVQLRKHAP